MLLMDNSLSVLWDMYFLISYILQWKVVKDKLWRFSNGQCFIDVMCVMYFLATPQD